jgi:hypothetical protein
MNPRQYLIQDFTAEQLKKAYSDPDRDVAMWSPNEVELMCYVNPLLVEDINKSTIYNFSTAEGSLEKQAQSLAMTLFCTIDNSFFNGIMKEGMVESKVKHLTNLYRALGESIGLENWVCPINKNDVDKDNFLEYAYFTKKAVLSEAQRFVDKNIGTRSIDREDSPDYVEQLVELFGENLDSIVRYGSRSGKDIDLMIFLKELDREVYTSIWDMGKEIKTEKPIGIVLVPTKGYMGIAHCGDSITTDPNPTVIYGKDVKVPDLGEGKVLELSYFKAGKELQTLRGNMTSTAVARITSNPNLRDYIFKQEIFFRKALRQMELGRTLSKAEFLKLEPVELAQFSEEPSYEEVLDAIIQTNIRGKNRVEEHFDFNYNF